MKHPAFSASTVFLALFFCACLPAVAKADDNTLPDSVRAHLHTPLARVGSGTYRRLGFSVYRATLWAPDGMWDAAKPYALQLRYARDVSRQTLVDTVTGDIRDQNVADDATLARWRGILDATLPDVEDGDVIIGLAIPGKKSLLFHNGTKIASIGDRAFSHAFFNIWLGKNADEDLRDKLLGKSQ
jgi:hypothetical protein